MKIIMLYGYLKRNLGDDLMIDILLKKYPNYIFFYQEREESENRFSDIFLNYSNFYNIEAFYKKYGRLNHIFNIITLYKKEDFFYKWLLKRIKKRTICSVYIGGSLFKENEETNIHKLIEHEEKKLSNGPLFIIGANFGPYLTPEFYNNYQNYYKKCGGVSFRDLYSFELFKDIKHVQYAPDVVFNINNQNLLNENYVLISVVDFCQKNEISKYADDYDQLIIKACKDALNHNLTPILQSCCKFEGDETAIQRILQKLDEPTRNKTQCYFYDGNIDECIKLFCKAKFIIATRFHSMVLAIKYNKQFYCLAYDKKIIKVLGDFNCTAYCKPDHFKFIIDDDVLLKCEKIYNVETIEKQAFKQFVLLDNYLKQI